MRYRVRSQDGEISFPTSLELSKAYRNGLVDPEDEVSEDGGTWRKVAALPELRDARPQKAGLSDPRTIVWSVFAAVLCAAALVAMAKGYVPFALVAAFASVGVLMRVTTGAFKKKRP